MLGNLYTTRYCMVDTETTGLVGYGSFLEHGHYPARPFAFSFTTMEGLNNYVRFMVNPYTRKVLYVRGSVEYQALKDFMEDPTIDKVFHNSNFDIVMFKHMGIEVKGRVWDTLTMAHCYKSSFRSMGLKPLAEELFGLGDEDRSDLQADVVKKRREGKKLGYKLAEDVEADYWLADEALCRKYAVTDTDRTRLLFIAFKDIYDQDPEYAAVVDMEHELLSVVRSMMMRGHRVDTEKIAELDIYYQKAIKRETEIKKDLGYENLNPNSPKQLQRVFYEELGLPPEYKTRKKPDGSRVRTVTCDTDALFKFSTHVPLAKCLVELSSAEHQLDSFIRPFAEMSYEESPGCKVLHPNYICSGPVTARLACTKPNLMNISSPESAKKKSEDVDYRAREAFIARLGCMLYFFDYSQIEVWIAAFLSQDPVMMEVLLNGGDMHSTTAEACFGHRPDFEKNFKKYRKQSKFVNFGSIYGAGVSALMVQAECSYEEAQLIHSKFWRKYLGLKDYNDAVSYQIRKQGFVTNPFGRKYRVDPDLSYKGLNYMVQGSAADVIKRAMINVHKLFNTKWKENYLQLTIHDELGMEIRKADHSIDLMKDITTAMQGNFHEFFGMPKPFVVSPSYSENSWKDKIELDEYFQLKAA